MNDLQITIFILGNPTFALIFYNIGRKIIYNKFSINLPFLPRSIYYYQTNNQLDNHHYQNIIFIPSMILAVFCSVMISGLLGGGIYVPKN